MMLLLIVAVVCLYLWANRTVPAAFQWETDYERGLAAASAAHRSVLLEFQTRGCPACAWMDRNVFSSPKVARALADWVPIRIDGHAEPRLAAQYSVEAFPTFLILAPDGRTLNTRTGAMPADEFIAFLKSAPASPPATAPATAISGDDIRVGILR